MNHCLLEATVKKVPTIRYTQDNKTPIAEMEVFIEGLRPDDPAGSLKVIGWGNMAQELQNRFEVGEKLILEGRLRMNTFTRQDGTKEKKAELTLSKVHPFMSVERNQNNPLQNVSKNNQFNQPNQNTPPPGESEKEEVINWNSSPLIPDTDDIPF